MFLDNLINRLKLITSWIKNKTSTFSYEDEDEEPPDMDIILSSYPEYLRYVYEIEHYGADYHDKLSNYLSFLESKKDIEFEGNKSFINPKY